MRWFVLVDEWDDASFDEVVKVMIDGESPTMELEFCRNSTGRCAATYRNSVFDYLRLRTVEDLEAWWDKAAPGAAIVVDRPKNYSSITDFFDVRDRQIVATFEDGGKFFVAIK